MRHKAILAFVGYLAAALPVVAFPFAGSAARAMVWDMATPYAEGNFHTRNIQEFARDVAAATDGELTIRVHAGGALIRHPEIKNAVRGGQVALGEFLLSRLSNEDSLFQLDSIPFLATDYDLARHLWAVSRPAIEARFKRQGLAVLFAVPWPPQGLFADRPLTSVLDLRGLKFRAYNAATERFAQLAGAVPAQIEVPDIPHAFATGRVEAMMTSPSTGADTKAWDYVTHYYHAQAWLPKNVVVANGRALAALPERVLAAVYAAAARAEVRGWTMSMAETEEKLTLLRQSGMSVSAPGPALAEGLEEIGAIMTRDWRERAGAEGGAILKAFRTAAGTAGPP